MWLNLSSAFVGKRMKKEGGNARGVPAHDGLIMRQDPVAGQNMKVHRKKKTYEEVSYWSRMTKAIATESLLLICKAMSMRAYVILGGSLAAKF